MPSVRESEGGASFFFSRGGRGLCGKKQADWEVCSHGSYPFRHGYLSLSCTVHQRHAEYMESLGLDANTLDIRTLANAIQWMAVSVRQSTEARSRLYRCAVFVTNDS